MTPKSFTDNFFASHLPESISSAEQIIPWVLQYVKPLSVIDIGCGVGAWLSVWEKKGIKDLLGVDGDYVKREELLINSEAFIAFDLTKGFSTNRKYDLASSLEVAEHIDQNSADIFVTSLCSLSDIVLFSAAIPGQEGTRHINEQYPDYWVKKFLKQGFVPVDCLRNKVWANEKISWWYRQNILFFVKESTLSGYDNLREERTNQVLAYVHPSLFEYKLYKVAEYEALLKSPYKILKFLIRRALGRHK